MTSEQKDDFREWYKTTAWEQTPEFVAHAMSGWLAGAAHDTAQHAEIPLPPIWMV